MKKIFSILTLIIIIVFVVQTCVVFFTKGYVKKYTIINNEKNFEISEKYQSKNGDIYSISIKNDEYYFSYVVDNSFNKQKKIIKSIEYYEKDDAFCIFPILIDDSGSYIECQKNGNLYTAFSYPDDALIKDFKNVLSEKNYKFESNNSIDKSEKYGNSTLYYGNLPSSDAVIFWQYKGINIMKKSKFHDASVLNFDKYDNKLGALVNNYYIIPCYKSSKVLEFSSVYIVNVNRYKVEKIDFKYTMSSSTYLNGVVDGKVYYTDPSNLIQIEINPSSKNVRLIGSKDIKAQAYNGEWYDVNIYDFKSKEIVFKDDSLKDKYNYIDIQKGSDSYYFYNSRGEVYQVPFDNNEKRILLFTASGLNNFNVVDSDIYYVVSNTLYKFDFINGSIPIMVNRDLQYNYKNRIEIYRK